MKNSSQKPHATDQKSGPDSELQSKGRILSAVSSSSMSIAIDIIIRILSIPFFLKAWGPALYGEWLLLTSLAQYASLLIGAVADVVTNQLLLNRTQSPSSELRKLYQVSSLVIRKLSVLTFIIYTVLAYILFSKPQLTPAIPRWNSVIVLMASLGIVVVGNLNRLPLGVLYAHGKVAASMQWKSLFVFVNGIVLFLCLFFKFSPQLLASTLFLLECSLFWLFRQVEGKRTLSGYAVQPNLGSSEILAPLLPLMLGSVCSGLAFSLLNQGFTQIVFLNLGPNVTVLFNTLRTLVRGLLLPIQLLASGVRYDLTSAYANNDSTLHQKIYFHTLRISQFFLVIGICIMLVGGESLLKTWTRSQLEWNPTLFRLLLFSMVFASFSSLANQILYSANQFLRIAAWQLALVSPLVVLGLTRFWPKTPIALGAGFLLNEILFALISLHCLRRVFNLQWRILLLRLLKPPSLREITHYLRLAFHR